MTNSSEFKDDLYFKYIAFKLYHFLKLIHGIELKTFFLFFGETNNQDIVLTDAKIFDAEWEKDLI